MIMATARFPATWEWSYVGEKGEEIFGRNSHTSGILTDSAKGIYIICMETIYSKSKDHRRFLFGDIWRCIA